MSDFFDTVRRYLLDYLPNQKGFSGNTVKSYRQALNLFVTFLREHRHFSIKKINFDVLNREIILDFLDYLENERNCSATTRNHRLMVLRSFFDYAGIIDCTQVALTVTVRNVPVKSTQPKIVEFLPEVALEALLKQPNPSKKKELRDLFYMVLMYDTAARCIEIKNMTVKDLRLNISHPIAYLHGKGGKTRTVPLLDKTVKHCKRYLGTFHSGETADSDAPLFYTMRNGLKRPMSEDNAAIFIEKYGTLARTVCPEMPGHLHPHMLRHTRAMHLYHQGMPIMLLSEYLGHASIESTKIYAYADTEMKRAAIDKVAIGFDVTDSIMPIWENDDDMILKLSGLV